MLKHFDSAGADYFPKVLHLSLVTLKIPDVWKLGRVVPLLKPVNRPSGLQSRIIILLSPVAKAAPVLHTPHQHGFRKVLSTTTALNAINIQIVHCLNRNRCFENHLISTVFFFRNLISTQRRRRVRSVSREARNLGAIARFLDPFQPSLTFNYKKGHAFFAWKNLLRHALPGKFVCFTVSVYILVGRNQRKRQCILFRHVGLQISPTVKYLNRLNTSSKRDEFSAK